jgi:O-methyltransferase
MIKQLKTFLASIGIGNSAIFGRYPYMFTPIQIAKLIDLGREAAAVPGSYVEVGCAYGATTVLMMKLFEELGTKKQGFALDTFQGFVKDHSNYDIEKLGMDGSLVEHFTQNDPSWLKASLKLANIDCVDIVPGDATKFDFRRCGPISFALLDVDLFQPIYDILPKLYKEMSPGGIIVVDDCAPSKKWEGALHAYRKFMADMQMPEQIVCHKLGIVRC